MVSETYILPPFACEPWRGGPCLSPLRIFPTVEYPLLFLMIKLLYEAANIFFWDGVAELHYIQTNKLMHRKAAAHLHLRIVKVILMSVIHIPNSMMGHHNNLLIAG
jgi:hypothetical protein